LSSEAKREAARGESNRPDRDARYNIDPPIKRMPYAAIEPVFRSSYAMGADGIHIDILEDSQEIMTILYNTRIESISPDMSRKPGFFVICHGKYPEDPLHYRG